MVCHKRKINESKDWTTDYKYKKDGCVSVIEHQFRNGVRLETNLHEQMVRKYHGDVMVDEFGLNPNVDSYVKLLENTAESVESNK